MVTSLLSFTYRYAVVPIFNSIEEEHYKFIAAAIIPAMTIIPAVICKHIALRRSSKVVHPGRSFVLVYIIRGGVIYVYRIKGYISITDEIVAIHYFTFTANCLLPKT